MGPVSVLVLSFCADTAGKIAAPDAGAQDQTSG
jgi:hypothetical protein